MENMIDMTGYSYVDHRGKYEFYRKIENDRGKWLAKDCETDEIFPITYMQARGFEPIVRDQIGELAHTLGRILLPH